MDIRVTVPNEFIVASNGSLVDTTTSWEFTTYWWHEQYPITTYLVSLAIYPYEVNVDQYVYDDNGSTESMDIHFYTFPGNYTKYYSIISKVKDMIAFFSDRYGQYPFIEEKYGQADIAMFGAMEHQTCSSFHFWNEWAFAHELAHQWWGDMITCESWHETWLNE